MKAPDRLESDKQAVDDQVLVMRGQGRSFGRIAEAVGLTRASQANAAFNRALRRRPAKEMAAIRSEENSRLDRLAASVRSDGSQSEADLERRLGVVEKLRARLMRD